MGTWSITGISEDPQLWGLLSELRRFRVNIAGLKFGDLVVANSDTKRERGNDLFVHSSCLATDVLREQQQVTYMKKEGVPCCQMYSDSPTLYSNILKGELDHAKL